MKFKKIAKNLLFVLLMSCFFLLTACGGNSADQSASSVLDSSFVESGSVSDSGSTQDSTNQSTSVEEDLGSYTVEFNANGGTGEMPSQTIRVGVPTALTKNQFTKTNYTFIGWGMAKLGATVDYTDGEQVFDLGAEDEVIELFAKWKKAEVAQPTDVETDLRLMSFNVRIGEKTDQRMSAVVKNIQDVDPDVFGVQEADGGWITYLNAKLPEYTSVGDGRETDRTGETTTVFFRADKYHLLQSGTKWLSLSPDTPSILEGGSEYKRIMTFVKLQDKQTGGVFVHINAHLDYSSDEIARQQANVVAEYAARFSQYPIFITGDFNQTPDSKTYAEMTKRGYSDSSLSASFSNRVGTFNGYTTDSSAHNVIDYCFVSKNNVTLSKYDTWNKSAENGGHNGFISDHYAIYVDAKVVNHGAPSTANTTLNNTVFQCGARIYGDVSFNSYNMDGATCSFVNKTVTLNISAGKTLTIDGFKSAADVGLKVTGGGRLIVHGDIVANTFTATEGVTVDVNGAIKANQVDLDAGTTVNVSVNGVDALEVNGNMTAYGTLNITNTSNSYTGISLRKQGGTLTINENSRVKVSGFSYAVGAWYGAVTFVVDANVTWETKGGYSVPKLTNTTTYLMELSNIVKDRWNGSVTVQ